MKFSLPFFVMTSILCHNSFAQEQKYQLDMTASFAHFEQQIKTEIGGAKGELLAADTEFNLQAMGSRSVGKYLQLGWFVQYDIGNRESARFSGFDANNAAEVFALQGGNYREFWTGPYARGVYKQAFLEVGYAVFGERDDDGREDIPNEIGDTDGAFRTDPAIAWLIGFGLKVPLWENWDLVAKAHYRVRYYNSRGGKDLDNQAVHGTQNFSPLLGVSYKF